MAHTTSNRPSDAAPIAVLLVEDDPGHAALVARRLGRPRPERFDLECAASLDEALRKLAERKFDAALVDLSLPDSSGMGTVLAVKAEDPELPVIVMTASDDESLELSACGPARRTTSSRETTTGRPFAAPFTTPSNDRAVSQPASAQRRR